MRKIILFMHVSLDGLVAGPNGELDWAKLGEDMWEYVNGVTAAADTAIFGDVTYHLMEDYWSTAAQKPNATKHDIDHARWVNAAQKIVFSQTLQTSNWQNTIIKSELKADEIRALKEKPGKNMVIFGSPTLAYSFTQLGLIDEYWLNINPIVLGSGKPLFKDIQNRMPLKLLGITEFRSGVVGLRYGLEK